jgi:small Trp-rich protein
MILIIIVALLTALKYFEVGPFGNLSWWWIVLAAFIAFLWFEFFERMLGLDKRKDHEAFNKIQKERVKRTFDHGKKKK